MKIENLYEGQEIKNYPELCKLLEIKKTTGYGKEKQMKELSSKVKLNKQGYKYIIEEIYKTPELSFNTNKNALSPKCDFVFCSLLSKLPKEVGTVSLSSSMLAKILGFYNSNYYKNKNKKREERDPTYNITKTEFYNKSSESFRYSVSAMLKRLQDKAIIIYNTNYSAYSFSEEIMDNIKEELEQNPRIILSSLEGKYKSEKKFYYSITNEEQEIYLGIIQKTLKKYNYEAISDVIKHGYLFNFYNDIATQCVTELGYFKIYKTYNISYAKKPAVKYANSLEEEVSSLNELLCKRLKQNKINREKNKFNKESENIFCDLCDTNIKLSEKEIKNYKNNSLKLMRLNSNHNLTTIPNDINNQALEAIEDFMFDNYL